MSVSIIIVTYNTATETLECLKSVFASKGLDAFEVIVIDNHSTDDTVELISKEFPKVQLINNDENLGFATAVNQGIKAAKGKFVFLLNPDAIVEIDTISKLAAYLEDNPKVGIVGPKILNFDGSVQRSVDPLPTLKHAFYEFLLMSRFFPKNRELGSLRMSGFNFNTTQTVDKLTGAAIMIRSEVFDHYGLFDESYFLYYEETDFMLRMQRDRQYQIVFYPEAIVRHYLNRSLGPTSTKTVNYSLTSMNHYYRKNYGWSYNLLENILTFLGAITNSVLLLLIAPIKTNAKDPLQWYLKVIRWYLSLRFMRP